MDLCLLKKKLNKEVQLPLFSFSLICTSDYTEGQKSSGKNVLAVVK